MPLYKYTAIDDYGKKIEGELEAISKILELKSDYLLDDTRSWPPTNSDSFCRLEDFPGKIRLAQPTVIGEGEIIPLVGYVSAGETEIAYGDAGYPTGHGIGEIGRPPEVYDPHAYAVTIQGDSMKPLLPEGSLVVVDTRKQPK